MVESKAMTRARRAAQSVVDGERILQFVEASRAQLVEAAEQGRPPVAAISAGLAAGFKEASKLPVRSFVGLCVRAVLSQEGFIVAEKGVRLPNDKIFRTGAVYRRIDADEDRDSSKDRLIDAIISSVTRAQAHAIIAGLKQRFPKIDK